MTFSADASLRLQGKVALITGGTGTIGSAIAARLARSGANIAITGFGDAASIDAQTKALARLGIRVEHIPADLATAQGCRDLFSTLLATFGRCDVLVNCAGVQHAALTVDFPEEKWDLILAVNLSAAFHLTKAAIPSMRKAGWGRIVNIASVHGLVASASKAPYVSSKHGLVGLSKVVALEEAERCITCNAICPGFVRTPLIEAQIDTLAKKTGVTHEAAAAKLVGAKMPTKRFVRAEDVAALTSFLCSEAAAAVTGSTYSMDGAWSAL